MKPSTNIKLVIPNMKILGGEDKKPGLLLNVVLVSVGCFQRRGPDLTKGCGLKPHRV
jgi:hypothetical protein